MTTASLIPASRRLIASLALAAVVAVSCVGDNQSAVEVQPIDQILDGDIRIEPDPAGTSAELRVSTSIPVACAVIYGVDDSFGSLAVDNDMQGGAHDEHMPTLIGLEPDTEYQYVLQGSDAEGSVYRSEVMTFRTPVPDDAPPLGINVATDGTVIASSSSFSDGFDDDLAIDGDTATEWSSDGDGDDAWIEVELASDTEVVGFGLRSREMSDGSAIIATYTVTVDDGEVLGPFEAGVDSVSVEAVTSGRRFRFDADTTSGGNTGATEIEIYTGP